MKDTRETFKPKHCNQTVTAMAKNEKRQADKTYYKDKSKKTNDKASTPPQNWVQSQVLQKVKQILFHM